MPLPNDDKEKTPQTKPMPADVARDPDKLREMLPGSELPEPGAGDTGKAPPPPTEDLDEPREPGTTEPQ